MKIPLVRKIFRASLALKRSLAGVQSHVHDKPRRQFELLAACPTLKLVNSVKLLVWFGEVLQIFLASRAVHGESHTFSSSATPEKLFNHYRQVSYLPTISTLWRCGVGLVAVFVRLLIHHPTQLVSTSELRAAVVFRIKKRNNGSLKCLALTEKSEAVNDYGVSRFAFITQRA